MADKKINPWLIVLVIGVIAFFVMQNGEKAPEVPVTPEPISDIVCESSTTPDLDINVYDLDNPGTAITEATNLYRKVGATAWTNFTQGSAIVGLEVNKKYEVILGITTSDFIDNAYGAYFITEPIGCNELETMDMGMYNDEDESAISATFYNKNHDASKETFTAGQVKNVYILIEAGSDEVFGNPFLASSELVDNGKHSKDTPNVFCMNLNKTEWDAPDGIYYGEAEMDSVSVPQRHSVSTGFTAYCYEMPVVTDLGQELKLRLDADDTTAPAANATASYFAANMYIDSDGELAWGVETDEGDAVGTNAAATVTLQFVD